MISIISQPSTDYLECTRRLRRLHDLIRSGDGDSEAADDLRDEMDGFWNRMTPEERKLSGVLSADLHSLGKPMPPLDQLGLEADLERHLEAIMQATDSRQSRELIDSGAIARSPSRAALLRAQYWLLANDVESSMDFLDEAGRLVPLEIEMIAFGGLASLSQLLPSRSTLEDPMALGKPSNRIDANFNYIIGQLEERKNAATGVADHIKILLKGMGTRVRDGETMPASIEGWNQIHSDILSQITSFTI